MNPAPGINEVRKRLAWSNTTLALFSFSAAAVVLVGSYLANGSGSEASGLFDEAQTVVMILFFLLLIQSVYYVLITRGRIRTSAEVSLYSLLDAESTYFIAFAAAASSCVYAISVVGHLSNSVSALTASSILALLFGIQLAYLAIGGRHERGK